MAEKELPAAGRVADEEGCWQAVLSRDAARDGTFVYAVRSTGVYCRPSCPSRRPRRCQVVFYPVPEAAERCGYRPCRRCRPRQARSTDPHVDLVQHICRYIEAHPDGPLTLEALGARAGVSPAHLQRLFKRLTGISPRQYAEACRLGRLKARLRERRTVAMTLYEAGYGSSRGLYKRASAQMGMTPATYQRGGPAVAIRYTLADCPLGRLLLAATERGICALYLGERDQPLEESLAREFPAASRRRDEAGLSVWLEEVLSQLRGRQPHRELPLDVRATAFQWRVWQELQKIPSGQTRTYKAVAEALGQPGAARAVARACATNPVSVLIPCHRVVRGDGDLGGYRWGLERKEKLLEQERAAAQPRTDPPAEPSA